MAYADDVVITERR